MASTANASQCMTQRKIVADKPDLSRDVHSCILCPSNPTSSCPTHCWARPHVCLFGVCAVGHGRALAWPCCSTSFPATRGSVQGAGVRQQHREGLLGGVKCIHVSICVTICTPLAVKIQQGNVHTYKIHSHLKQSFRLLRVVWARYSAEQGSHQCSYSDGLF